MTKLDKKSFINSLICSKLDKNITINHVGAFSCSDVFGTVYPSNTPDGLLYNLKYLGADVTEVVYDEPFWVLNGVGSEKVVTPVVEKVEESEIVPEVVVESTEVATDTLISFSTDVEETPAEKTTEVDWEWVDGLVNNKASKVELDEYAEKEFGIELNRRQTLDNMRKEFRKAVEA